MNASPLESDVEWRDPESNRGHHDFSEGRENPWLSADLQDFFW
jgi:hypothetical protein